MTSNMKMKLTLTAAIGLCLYAAYKIIIMAARIFDPLRFHSYTILEKLRSLFAFNISSWVLLTLGICGILLVVSDYYKIGDLSIPKQITKAKTIVFLSFIIFVIYSLLVSIYYIFISFSTYRDCLASGGGMAISPLSFWFSMIGLPFGILLCTGEILFGSYILLEKVRFRKPALIMYLIVYPLSRHNFQNLNVPNTLVHISALTSLLDCLSIA